jgi:hypothetical protein
MMRHTVITESGDKLTGEVRTVVTACDIRLTGSAFLYLTGGAVWANRTFTETTFAGYLLYRHIPAFCQSLKETLQTLPVNIMPGAIKSASSTVKSADSAKMYTLHSYISFPLR